MSSDQGAPGWLGYIRDGPLPSYIEIIAIFQYKDSHTAASGLQPQEGFLRVSSTYWIRFSFPKQKVVFHGKNYVQFLLLPWFIASILWSGEIIRVQPPQCFPYVKMGFTNSCSFPSLPNALWADIWTHKDLLTRPVVRGFWKTRDWSTMLDLMITTYTNRVIAEMVMNIPKAPDSRNAASWGRSLLPASKLPLGDWRGGTIVVRSGVLCLGGSGGPVVNLHNKYVFSFLKQNWGVPCVFFVV